MSPTRIGRTKGMLATANTVVGIKTAIMLEMALITQDDYPERSGIPDRGSEWQSGDAW